MNCQYCSKEVKNKISKSQHEIRCKENPDKIKTSLSKETKLKLSKIMKTANTNADRIWTDKMRKNASIKSKEANRKAWTKEKREIHSKKMKQVVLENPESYSSNNVSGRAKIYEYDGVKLKGKWELLIAKKLNENDIEWTNDIEPLPYFWNDKWHLYFPDFYLKKYDLFIEVKGYERDRDLAKWKACKNLLVLKEKEIKEISKNKENIKRYIAGWTGVGTSLVS